MLFVYFAIVLLFANFTHKSLLSAKHKIITCVYVSGYVFKGDLHIPISLILLISSVVVLWPSIWGKLSFSCIVSQYCTSCTTSNMHIQRFSLHPFGVSLLSSSIGNTLQLHLMVSISVWHGSFSAFIQLVFSL